MKNAAAKFPFESDRQHFLRISNHNFHDATLEEIRVEPAQSKRERARLVVVLAFPNVRLLFTLTFTGCMNVSMGMDFDVLLENHPCNTCVHSRHSDSAKIQQFVQSQVAIWNVRYRDGVGSENPGCHAFGDSPLKAKLARAGSTTLHHLKFFGGEMIVVCSACKIERRDLRPGELGRSKRTMTKRARQPVKKRR